MPPFDPHFALMLHYTNALGCEWWLEYLGRSTLQDLNGATIIEAKCIPTK